MKVTALLHVESHAGLLRTRNEDAFAVLPTADDGWLLMVCDGMGGMGRGDEASRLAVETLTDLLRDGSGFPPQRLDAALRSTDTLIRQQLCNEADGQAGSTAAIVYLLEGLGHVGWVGDSRAYHLRGGRILERTKDHKLVEELVDAGEITREEARLSSMSNVITRALGGRLPSAPVVRADVFDHPWRLEPGDHLVLCTDGLCDLVTDDELPFFFDGRGPRDVALSLVQAALARGGHDNITVIVVEWTNPEEQYELQQLVGWQGVVLDADGNEVPPTASYDLPEPIHPLPELQALLSRPNVATAELAPAREASPEQDAEDRRERRMVMLAILLALVLVIAALVAGRSLFDEVFPGLGVDVSETP